MHSVSEALTIIAHTAQPLEPETVSIGNAHGRLLKQPVTLASDSPPFDRALVDGYAVRASDATSGARLSIVGRQDAGGPLFGSPLSPTTCVAINTGAPVPAGADAVVMVEKTRPVAGSPTVEILVAASAESGIQRRGSFARSGQVVIPAETHLDAGTLASAISAGAGSLLVQRIPRVAILATGDELVPPGAHLTPGKIHNSNLPMLAALLAEANALPLDLGIIPDDPPVLRSAIQKGLVEADVLLVSGGMSMGTKDFIPSLLADLGIVFHIQKVTMKPGKPFAFGTLSTPGGVKYVCGLPGNPVSTFVTFQLFVRHLLHMLAGTTPPPPLTARTTHTIAPNADRTFFLPCRLHMENATLLAAPIGWKGSGNALALQSLHGMIIRDISTPAAHPGDLVTLLPFHTPW